MPGTSPRSGEELASKKKKNTKEDKDQRRKPERPEKNFFEGHEKNKRVSNQIEVRKQESGVGS